MACNFKYYSEEDIFYISREDIFGEIFSSLPVGNFVFDVDDSGKIVSLGIDNASEVFGVSSDKIKAKSANLGTTIQGNMLLIHFVIDLGIKIYNFSYVFPRNKISLIA